jgi:hypothetical protein
MAIEAHSFGGHGAGGRQASGESGIHEYFIAARLSLKRPVTERRHRVVASRSNQRFTSSTSNMSTRPTLSAGQPFALHVFTVRGATP